MEEFVFPPPKPVCIPTDKGVKFPVRRIFCVGKNYADHVQEMGGDAKKDKPTFFTKPRDAIVLSGRDVPYGVQSDDFHYEGELVIALKSGGCSIAHENAMTHIFGFAAGCDLTRRDMQREAKQAGNPWDSAKAFDYSAPIATIKEMREVPQGILKTSINNKPRQEAPLSQMIWSVPEIIVALSGLFELKAGDLIFTGTPAGVGPLKIGDRVRVEIADLPVLDFKITDPKS